MLNYYQNGICIDEPKAFAIALKSCEFSPIDIDELGGIIRRMNEEEEAREMFESITGIEVVKWEE